MSNESASLDVRQLGRAPAQEVAEAPFPGLGRQDFRIFLSPESHADILRHASEHRDVEIGGVLVGKWERDADGPFVRVQSALRCDAATSKSGEVTFTHEAWNDIHREMDTRFAQSRIVGWYHSHPGFGVFLSDRDRFIHEHFFNNPGQIAMVVDPSDGTEGIFAWREGKPALWPHYWVGVQIQTSRGLESESVKTKRPALMGAPGGAAPSSPGCSCEPSLFPNLNRLAVYVLVFLVGYMLAGLRSGWEQRMISHGAVAHYGLWKGLKPGLRVGLEMVAKLIDESAAQARSLAAEHEKIAGEKAPEVAKQWNAVFEALAHGSKTLRSFGELYGLSAEEEDVLRKIIEEKQLELDGMKRVEIVAPPAKNGPAKEPAAKERAAQEPPAKEAAPKAPPFKEAPAKDAPPTK